MTTERRRDGLRLFVMAIGLIASATTSACGFNPWPSCSTTIDDPKKGCVCDTEAQMDRRDPRGCCTNHGICGGAGGAGGAGGSSSACVYDVPNGDAIAILGGLTFVGDRNGGGLLDAGEPFTVSWVYKNYAKTTSKASDALGLTPMLQVVEITGTVRDQQFPYKISALDSCTTESKSQRFASGLTEGSYQFTLVGYAPLSNVSASIAIGFFPDTASNAGTGGSNGTGGSGAGGMTGAGGAATGGSGTGGAGSGGMGDPEFP